MLKYRVNLSFNIGLHNKDLELLKLIKAYFGKGGIIKLGKQSSLFRISSIEDLKVVFDHFDAYPLLTQKKADYILFKQVYEIVSTKGHLSLDFRPPRPPFLSSPSLLWRGLLSSLLVPFRGALPRMRDKPAPRARIIY